ncbi:hypothetical protein K435DRAFT_802263 [Dendrothele bispora CBS 962.96]|uniref:Plastocyanin-like domain-containing protein n=1 Tax=Dendrothele bispora (strain CBS 962.96) TaxID=1314807 RepID=A0A4S8LLV3_DENBC|nr:hypothetical protein K435DRAFT_802263 [Dendrothele bispora CBS 962.96]
MDVDAEKHRVRVRELQNVRVAGEKAVSASRHREAQGVSARVTNARVAVTDAKSQCHGKMDVDVKKHQVGNIDAESMMGRSARARAAIASERIASERIASARVARARVTDAKSMSQEKWEPDTGGEKKGIDLEAGKQQETAKVSAPSNANEIKSIITAILAETPHKNFVIPEDRDAIRKILVDLAKFRMEVVATDQADLAWILIRTGIRYAHYDTELLIEREDPDWDDPDSKQSSSDTSPGTFWNCYLRLLEILSFVEQTLSVRNVFTVGFDGHNMTIIAVDGESIEPHFVSSIEMLAGQRYDVVVTADQEFGNYWFNVPYVGGSPVNTAYFRPKLKR